jgi:hypothetical protein
MLGSLVFLLLLVQAPAPPPQLDRPDRDDVIRQLTKRVQELEVEVGGLQGEHPLALPQPPAQAPASPPSPPPPPPHPQEPVDMGMPPTSESSSEFPTMQFRGFSDLSYRATDLEGGENSFALGQFNLFITSSLSHRMSVLAEAVLEADDKNQFGFELERLLWRYAVNEYLNVAVGRYHTAIGWYNTAYHHSAWLQTAVGRPYIFMFEDEGGLLPIHNVGVSMTGRIPSGSVGLHYVAEIGNGRASTSPLDQPTQNVVDENRGKAVNFGLGARPKGLRGLDVGFSVYYDRLTPEATPHVDQSIFAVYGVYQTPAAEWLNEAIFVRHGVVGSSDVKTTRSFYTQLSQRFGRLRPYLRYQYIDVPDDDPYFTAGGSVQGPSVGLRTDLNQFSAFKVQYDHAAQRGATSYNAVTLQLSFVF